MNLLSRSSFHVFLFLSCFLFAGLIQDPNATGTAASAASMPQSGNPLLGGNKRKTQKQTKKSPTKNKQEASTESFDPNDPLAAAIQLQKNKIASKQKLSPPSSEEQEKPKKRSGGMQVKNQPNLNLPPIRAIKGKRIPLPHKAFELIKRSNNTWEFGIEVTANGPTAGITTTFPIPIDWPEQRVKVLSTFKSKSVKSVKIKAFGKLAKQAIVKIPRLGNGQTARVVVTVELERFDTVSPKELPELKFAEKKDRDGRAFLKPSPYIESNHKKIKELAAKLSFPDLSPYRQVEEIYKWVQTNIEYRFDPQIHSCLEALDNKVGDCEEVASLFVAICRAKGIPARAVWCNDHTYPEFMLKTTEGETVWLPCEITSFEHVFGQVFGDRPILQKGDRFKILGHRKEQRYIMPTLSASRATASPMLKWISRKKVTGAGGKTGEPPVNPLKSPPAERKGNPLKNRSKNGPLG